MDYETTNGLCGCGCGRTTSIATMTDKRRGVVKGKHRRFIAGHRAAQPGSYRLRKVDSTCVANHILIARKALGKPLPPGAQVHHVDGNPSNNDPRNLVICQDQRYHHLLHVRASVLKAGGNPNTDKVCCVCHNAKPFDSFGKGTGPYGRHNACRLCRSPKKAVAA